MELVADLHTHTTASGHAYSSLHEMIEASRKIGLRALATTDHGIAMPGTAHRWHFERMIYLPNIIDDFLLLKGIEANAIDLDGSLDMDDEVLWDLDWVIVSLHRHCIAPMNYEETTNMWLKIAENPVVDMIGHSEEQRFFYDYDKVTKAFTKGNKVVEFNASSPLSRPGNEENMRNLAIACKKNNTKIAVNSDAHSMYELGNTSEVVAMLEKLNYPEELIINSSMERLTAELVLHGRPFAQQIKGFR